MTVLPESHLEIFDDRPTGYLATVRPDGHLSVNPVAVLRDGDDVLVSTVRTRRKVRNVEADGRAAICVVDRNDPNRYLEVRGPAEVVDDPDRATCNRMARAYMGVDEYPFDRPGDERVVIVIHPAQVSAPRIPLAGGRSPLRPDGGT